MEGASTEKFQENCRNASPNVISLQNQHQQETISWFLFFLFAVLGLCCCRWTFSGCREQGLLFTVVLRASHCSSFSCCGAQALGRAGSVMWLSRAYLPSGMWNILGPWIELVSLTVTDRFLTVGPPGKC